MLERLLTLHPSCLQVPAIGGAVRNDHHLRPQRGQRPHRQHIAPPLREVLQKSWRPLLPPSVRVSLVAVDGVVNIHPQQLNARPCSIKFDICTSEMRTMRAQWVPVRYAYQSSMNITMATGLQRMIKQLQGQLSLQVFLPMFQQRTSLVRRMRFPRTLKVHEYRIWDTHVKVRSDQAGEAVKALVWRRRRRRAAERRQHPVAEWKQSICTTPLDTQCRLPG